MKCAFTDFAAEEFVEAVDYYETCRVGLGEEFGAAVHEAASRLVGQPEAFPVLRCHFSRCRVKRFPYGLVNTAVNTEIVIVAVMHLHRRPGYWVARTGSGGAEREP